MQKPQTLPKSRWLWLFVLGFLFNMIYVGLYYQMDDEAVCVLAVQRILAGELPYRDFTSDISPGSYFLSLPFFALLGFAPEAIRGLLALLAALTGLVVQAISNRVMPVSWRYLPWLVWVCGGLATHMIFNYHWFGALFLSAGAYCSMGWLETGSRRWGLSLGVCGGLSFWCLQSDGAVLALATVMLWLRFRPRGLHWVFLGALASSILLWLPLFPWRSTIWNENFRVIGHHLASRRTGFQFRLGPDMVADYLRQPANLVQLSGVLLTLERYTFFYPVLLAGVVLAERRRDVFFCVLCYSVLAFMVVNWPRQTVAYLGYCGALYGLVFCRLLSLVSSKKLPKVLAILTLLQFALNWHALNSRFCIAIQTRSGVYWSENRVEAALMAHLHEWVQLYTPPSTAVFAYPYFTSLYTTEFLVNPTREPLFVEGVFPIERMRACKQVLRTKKIEYLFVQPLVPEAVAEVCSLSSEEFQRVSAEWRTELLEDYEPFQKQGSLTLYRRRADLP